MCILFYRGTDISKYYKPSEGKFIIQDISDTTAYKLMQEILAYADKYPSQQITLYIQSEGGSVTAGVAIYDLLKSLSNPIQTVAVDKVGGIAVLLLVTGKSGRRVAHPKTKITLGQFTIKPNEENSLEHIYSVVNKVIDILSNVTDMTIEEIKATLKQRKVISSQRALEVGLLDRIERI